MRLGRFGRPAGYNMAVDLRTSRPVRVDEILEARDGGRLVMRATVASVQRKSGRFQSKHRVEETRASLTPGIYDMKLRVVADGQDVASHQYKLEVR
jgi:hypothetical protein